MSWQESVRNGETDDVEEREQTAYESRACGISKAERMKRETEGQKNAIK
jgi:hypothetical protein